MRVLLFFLLPLLLASCQPSPPPASDELIREVPTGEFNRAPPAAQKYKAILFREARAVWGLNAPIPALAAQIQQESGWNPNARSPVGAGGLTQFMPATATDFPDEQGRVDVYNPQWALRAQSRYMRSLYERAGTGVECEDYAFALAGYNGGEGWRIRDQKLATSRGLDPKRYWGHVETVNAGRNAAAWNENREYAPRVVKHWQPVYAGWGRIVCGEFLR